MSAVHEKLEEILESMNGEDFLSDTSYECAALMKAYKRLIK